MNDDQLNLLEFEQDQNENELLFTVCLIFTSLSLEFTQSGKSQFQKFDLEKVQMVRVEWLLRRRVLISWLR